MENERKIEPGITLRVQENCPNPDPLKRHVVTITATTEEESRALQRMADVFEKRIPGVVEMVAIDYEAGPGDYLNLYTSLITA